MNPLSRRRILPVIYQGEHAECGLACVAMVAAYHGHPIDLGLLRERADVSSRGTSLRELIRIADSLRLRSRVVHVEPESIHRLRVPAIVHWDLSHYVVVRRVSKRRVEVHDPNHGRVSIPLNELGRHLSGIAVELSPGQAFQATNEFRGVSLANLVPKDLKVGGRLGAVAASALLAQLLALVAPFYFQVVIDRTLPSFSIQALGWLTALFIVLVLVEWIVKHLRNTAALHLSMLANARLSVSLLERLLRLPLGYFESRTISGLMAKFDSLDEVRTILCEDAVRLLIDLLMCIAFALVMFLYSPALFGVTMLFVLGYAGYRFATFESFRLATQDQIVRKAEQRNHLLQTVQYAHVVKAYGTEGSRLEQWRALLADDLRGDHRINQARSNFDHARDGVTALELMVTGYLCFLQVMAGSMTLGMVFAFLAYKRLFVSSAFGVVEVVFKIKTVGTHMNHLSDLVHTPPTEYAGVLPVSRTDFDKPIRIERLSFRFRGESSDVFQNVSAVVEPSSRLVIAGPTGSGKTTLVKLLLRLEMPKAGSIRLGDVDVSQLDHHAWLSYIGAVLQGGSLFSATIRENIAYGVAEIDDERVSWAAQMACVNEEIDRLPMGYETYLGDRGGVLSAGQIQRILIARALYRDPAVLIMDEGTANLDQETEAAVLKNLRKLKITTIHAAHRAQVIADATHVVRLEQLAAVPEQMAVDA